MSTAVAPTDRHTLTLAENRKLTLLRPMAEPAEIMEVQNATRAFVHQALVEGRDYGAIPGTEKKTLLKPGAERTALGFGCYYGDPVIVESEVDHNREVPWRKVKKIHEWNGNKRGKWLRDEVTEGASLGLYRYVVKVPLIHAETGRTIATGIGVCSTMESKYIDRPRDSENTALKMAHKRALVAACLMGFGLSDEFTQDLEDSPLATGDGDTPVAASTRNEESAAAATAEVPNCPICNGRMWDNRENKRNPKAPDFKCRDRKCDGVVWHLVEVQREPAQEAASAPHTMQLADAEAFIVPRGNAKGQRVDSLTPIQMQAALLWTADNDTEPEFQLALATVLDAREKSEAKGAPAGGDDASQDSPAGTTDPRTLATSAPSAASLALEEVDQYPDGTDKLTSGQRKTKVIELLKHPAVAGNSVYVAGTMRQIQPPITIHQLRATVRTIEAMIASAPVKGKKGPHRIGDLPGDPA